MRTIGGKWVEGGQRGPGFPAVRLFLALAIIVYHATDVTLGSNANNGVLWALAESIVPAFFVLSGFLVTASAERLCLREFLTHRALRIFPALAVATLFAAFLIGPAVTHRSPAGYFHDRALWHYLLNAIGSTHFNLPGVFLGRPHSGMVNVSLWTIPWELSCYAATALAMSAAARKRSALTLGAAVTFLLAPAIAYCVIFAMTLFPATNASGTALLAANNYFTASRFAISEASVSGRGAHWLVILTSWEFRVIPYYIAGSLAWIWRDRLPWSPRMAVASFLVILGCGVLPPIDQQPLFNVVLVPPVACIALTCGLARIGLPAWTRDNDLSYGIYLYGYPIQQFVCWSGFDHLDWRLNALLAMPVTCLLALFSWRFVEKPALAMRHTVGERLRELLALIRPRQAA